MDLNVIRYCLQQAHDRLIRAGYDYQAKRLEPVLAFVAEAIALQGAAALEGETEGETEGATTEQDTLPAALPSNSPGPIA